MMNCGTGGISTASPDPDIIFVPPETVAGSIATTKRTWDPIRIGLKSGPQNMVFKAIKTGIPDEKSRFLTRCCTPLSPARHNASQKLQNKQGELDSVTY